MTVKDYLNLNLNIPLGNVCMLAISYALQSESIVLLTLIHVATVVILKVSMYGQDM